MKAISFLGIGNYSRTTFHFDDQVYETRFFPAALAQFVQPQKLLLFVTPTVLAHQNLADLSSELGSLKVEWQPVEIPEGRNETDLWEIFAKLTSSVDAGESVIFDVTHSFRSLPMLAFLAVAYLKAAKSVHVERVLYGAFEARDDDNQSPVFDLTPFVSLLDWLSATDRFVEIGDGGPLAGLLRQGKPSGNQMGKDLKVRALGQDLMRAADAIQAISLALDVTRPIETMRSAAQMASILHQAMPAFEQRARPFSILAERVIDEYNQFALEDPSEAGLIDGLHRQLFMIDWYIQRRRVVQAATLAREWLVSILAYRLGAPVFDYSTGRKLIEGALNNAVELSRAEKRRITPSQYDSAYQGLEQSRQVTALWSRITELRNDIAHVGMRSNPKTAKQLEKDVRSLLKPLQAIADAFLPIVKPTDLP